MRNTIAIALLAIITLGSYQIGRVVADQYWKAKVEEAIWRTRQENAVVYSAPCPSTVAVPTTTAMPTTTYCGIANEWVGTNLTITSATATTGTCITVQP